MSWSGFFRMLLLICVWMGAGFALSQSTRPLLERRRMNTEEPNVSAEPNKTNTVKKSSGHLFTQAEVSGAKQSSPTAWKKYTRKRRIFSRQNILIGVIAVLLIGVVGQAIFMMHTSLSNTFFSGNSTNAAGVSFITNTPVATVTRTQTFETGIVTPQWQQSTAYGTDWQQSLSDIKTQTGAKWIELSLLFSQASSSSTSVGISQSTPLVASFAAGIRAAHAKGFHVFVVPLMGVRTAGGWAGSIQFSSQGQEQAWFDSYWNTYKPYVEAAAQAGADQMAIATECSWLQQNVPASMWNELITRIHAVFAGTLTYDMNWYPTNQPIPSWFSNQNISMIGVSSYIPLTSVSQRIAPADMFALWRDKIKSILDSVSSRVGKPVLVSEIGYRNTSDALYNSWEQDSNLPADSAEQAGAYDAALANVIPDQRIAGIFFWGWDNVGRFTLNGQDATNTVLHKWYTSVQ